jgi:hypothetical protein
MARLPVYEALARVYDTFNAVPKPRQIAWCSHCIPDDEVRSLLETPLRQLTPQQLASYAASVFLTAGGAPDFRYFLPRILDISLHEPFWYPDREIVLGKLTLAGWKSWPDNETQPLLILFKEAFDDAIATPDDGSEVDSWICGLALAEVDLNPFLRSLLRPPALPALIGFFEKNSAHLVKGKLGNAFWKDHKASAVPVIAWFQSVDVQAIVQSHYEKLARGDV